jgi:hypothetical protein
MSVKASFPMVCRECQRPIEKGDVIEKREITWQPELGSAWVHADCSHLPSEVDRKRSYAARQRRNRNA